jgi:hypothetical protein
MSTSPCSSVGVDLENRTSRWRLGQQWLHQFNHPAVRDLAWILSAPPLLSCDRFGEQLATVGGDAIEQDRIGSWLAMLDKQPEPLLAQLRAAPQRRLGLYAEQLLHFYLVNTPGQRVIDANRPLTIDRRTVGEFDYLLQTADGRYRHWEFAVKCYLLAEYLPEPSRESVGTAANSLARCVGPSLRDRLDHKVRRLLDHQLPLSRRPEFREHYPQQDWFAQILMPGWLFHPYQADSLLSIATNSTAEPGPEAGLNPGHLRGWWQTCDAWKARRDDAGVDAWTLLPRLSWMAPIRLAADHLDDPARLDAWLASWLDRRIEGGLEPVLIAGLRATANGFEEVTRGFLVDQDWPARAAAYARTTS